MAALLVLVHGATAAAAVRASRADWLHAAVLSRPPALRVWTGGELASLVPAEPWRLCTSVLLHNDLLHLLLNTTALLALGSILEPLLGRLRWASVFALGGLGGSIVPWLVGVRQSDGASGAAFALLGAGMSFGLARRRSLDAEDRRLLGPVFLAFTVLNLLAGLVIPTIDVSAHLGGLVVGLGVGALPRRASVEAIEALAVGGFLGACVFGWS